jgi:hypothetical protein
MGKLVSPSGGHVSVGVPIGVPVVTALDSGLCPSVSVVLNQDFISNRWPLNVTGSTACNALNNVMTRVRNPGDTGTHLPKGRRPFTSFVGWKYTMGQQFLIPSQYGPGRPLYRKIHSARSHRPALGSRCDRRFV